jgi:hypothetical protein
VSRMLGRYVVCSVCWCAKCHGTWIQAGNSISRSATSTVTLISFVTAVILSAMSSPAVHRKRHLTCDRDLHPHSHGIVAFELFYKLASSNRQLGIDKAREKMNPMDSSPAHLGPIWSGASIRA